ncbi:hypothetical protein LIER_42453 [Lithospermum erythrorhizon]|uniref:Glucose-methanol-choline oxidoreductase N-terminal domain-containing protein n=1 Tax=Lithospermum erythrorhizon TaxID=34254 RepID=A0AAV3RQJ2_LITER
MAMVKRHTAADLLEYAKPDRLTVFLHANVEKILFATNNGESKPLAQGVLFISAGALGSPQLLMLSGIGPAEHLKSHNISVVLNQPFVGQDMKDNPMNPIFVASPVPIEVSLVQHVGITPFGSYIEAASGTLLNNIFNTTSVGCLHQR